MAKKDKEEQVIDTNNTGTEGTGAGTTNEATPANPWEEIMKERRKGLVQEKTDAEKMQRYHALTDVFNALGKMGGSVIGGAIGGDALVGTSTKDYQPNRGYLDAIEKAKAANDRIRALDDTAFQLHANKQLRDEQWAREDKKIAEQREYETQVRQIQMDFQAELARLNNEWAMASIERKKEIEIELAELQQKHQKELLRLKDELGGYGYGSGSGSGSRPKLRQISVNGKNYTIDMSNGVQISEIYNMIPAAEDGSRPYGKATYWDGEVVGRQNPTLDEMIAAIGQNVNNEDFISAFENRFGRGNNGGNGGQTSAAQDELNVIING
jgi:hypothetical protein